MSKVGENGIGGMHRRDFLKVGAAAAATGMLIPGQSEAQGNARGANQAGAGNQNGPLLAGDNSYAAKLTASSVLPSNMPQRPGPPTAIDVHCHWAPDVYLKAKADLGRPDFLSPSNHDLALRAKWMDEHGEKMQVLTLGGFMPWQWVTPEQGVHIAQITNDAAMEAHQSMPDRFLFGIELPVGYAKGALEELNRVAGKPGMVAVHLPNSLAAREYLFEPEFGPVLARIQELNLPILLHPLDGEPNWYAGHRLDDEASGVNPNANPTANLFPGLTNSVGETFEQATTVSKFIVSGTMDKYPELTIIVNHAGGAFPYIVGRLDRGNGGGRLKQPVHAYIRRFYYDDLAWYPLTLKYLIDLVGSDRVVVGTDNMGVTTNNAGAANRPAGNANGAGPAGNGGAAGGNAAGGGRNGNNPGGANAAPGAGVPGPNSVLDQVDLSPADRDLILRGNASKLFKL